MLHRIKALAVGVALLVPLGAGVLPAWATCKNAVCATGSDDSLKRTHIVYLTSQLSGTTHYNIVPPGGSQMELHIDHFEFSIKPGQTYRYSVQACKKGSGPFASSTCTKWASFTHKVAASVTHRVPCRLRTNWWLCHRS